MFQTDITYFKRSVKRQSHGMKYMPLLFTKNRTHVYFCEGSQNGIKIWLYSYGRVQLATGYNGTLFKNMLLVLSLFPN